jgi:hypothetical protein
MNSLISDDRPLSVHGPALLREKHTFEVLAEVGYDEVSNPLIMSRAVHVNGD